MIAALVAKEINEVGMWTSSQCSRATPNKLGDPDILLNWHEDV